MTTIAVIGPGAIGGTLAAWLGQDSALDIVVCARTPFDGLVVDTHVGQIKSNPRVLTRPEDAPVADWVLVATKTYDVETTKPWLDQLVGQGTRVAIVQNGVEHVRLFSHIVPAERLLPVIINLPAERTAPGRMKQHRHGTIGVPTGSDGEEFVALFGHTEIDAAVDPDFQSRIWTKLCGNCAAIVPALTLRATGPVWNDDLEAIIRGLIEECAAVGRAEGAHIAQSFIEASVGHSRSLEEGSYAGSIHVDRMAGNRMEIDARNGVIVRLGAKHGIATPMNSLLVTLLSASGSPWIK